jgi:hypothetical protein
MTMHVSLCALRRAAGQIPAGWFVKLQTATAAVSWTIIAGTVGTVIATIARTGMTMRTIAITGKTAGTGRMTATIRVILYALPGMRRIQAFSVIRIIMKCGKPLPVLPYLFSRLKSESTTPENITEASRHMMKQCRANGVTR